MTKNVQLTQAYIDIIFKKVSGGKLIFGKYHFFNCTQPERDPGKEGFRFEDVDTDPTNVPIYDQEKGSSSFGDIIRFEGSVENPIESYKLNFGDIISMPNAVADKWLAMKVKVRDPDDLTKFLDKNIFEEVFEEVT